MLPVIKVISPDDALRRLERELGPRGYRSRADKALQRAVSETVTTGRALLARRIADEVRLKISDIKKNAISVKRGSWDKPEGVIVLKQHGTWLSQYATAKQMKAWISRTVSTREKQRARRKAKPPVVRVSVRKRPAAKYPVREVWPHAFWGTMPGNAHIGIFQRTGTMGTMIRGRYKGKVREKIKRMRGPSALGVFLHARGRQGAMTVAEEVSDRLHDELRKNILERIRYEKLVDLGVLEKRGSWWKNRK